MNKMNKLKHCIGAINHFLDPFDFGSAAFDFSFGSAAFDFSFFFLRLSSSESESESDELLEEPDELLLDPELELEPDLDLRERLLRVLRALLAFLDLWDLEWCLGLPSEDEEAEC